MYNELEIQNCGEMFRFAFDYLKETNYELAEELSDYVLNGKGDAEVILETAAEISFNRSMSSCAMFFVKIYEDEMIRTKGSSCPFVVHSVRELISRNIITQQDNAKNKRLYVIKMNNETVKIGIATDINRRFRQIESASGMEITKASYTDIFPKAHEKELQLHKKYGKNRLKGEYFSCSFTQARDDLLKIAREENINVFAVR